MSLPQNSGQKNRQRIINLAIAGIVGQVGCLTLLIVLGAIFGGLWLDNQFNTRPVITIVLVITSIPVSVLLMLAVVRAGVARIKPQLTEPKKDQEEEADLGKYS